MKEYLKICKLRLDNLIKRVYFELTNDQRTKIITVITIDVHARDVIEKMVLKKTNNVGDFFWQCQLKFEFNDFETVFPGVKKESWKMADIKTCICKICDWVQEYS